VASKTQDSFYALSQLAVFVNCGGCRLWFGSDDNLDVSALLELHTITLFVG
jgi:hypothetical protein